MNFGLMHSIWTVMLFVLFIGIIVWAWSAKRKRGFDEAARLPLEDEDSHLLPLSQSEEKRAQRATARLPLPLGRGSEGEGSGRGQGERGKPLIPTPSPSRGEGSEPSALRATSFTRGGKPHG